MEYTYKNLSKLSGINEYMLKQLKPAMSKCNEDKITLEMCDAELAALREEDSMHQFRERAALHKMCYANQHGGSIGTDGYLDSPVESDFYQYAYREIISGKEFQTLNYPENTEIL